MHTRNISHLNSQGATISSDGQRRLSDYAYAKVDKSIRWTHMQY